MLSVTHEAITFIRPTALTDQAPYAYAAMTGAQQAIYTAGACPLDEAGRTVAVCVFVGQAQQVMANLVTTLREAGAELTDVVKSTVYVASNQRDDLNLVWDVVHSTFGPHDAPSTLLGVSVLGWPDQLVEVEAIAVVAAPAATR
jgi:enamine deaminase RidA (YjgF/YER057c/UK114 family)